MKRLLTITLNMLCALILCGYQNPIDSYKQSTKAILVKKATTDVLQIPVVELDSKLPTTQLADWFLQQVGNKAGIIWQLTECGAGNSNTDIQACSEVNAVLPDSRKVILMISIGGFKNGVTGNPKFMYGVIDKDGELYQIYRLSDLPAMLHGDITKSKDNATQAPLVQIPVIPDINVFQVTADHKLIQTEAMQEKVSATNDVIPDAPPLPSSLRLLTVADAVVKVNPQYPAVAHKFKASGNVEVLISVSQEGIVIDARVLRGNPLFQEAAIKAARQWKFNPAFRGESTQLTLTFEFKIPQ